MAIFQNIRRLLKELQRKGKPHTVIASSSRKMDLFSERDRNRTLLKKYETIYKQGGLVSEAIDSYAMYCLSHGWKLEGDEAYTTQVQSFLDSVDFDSVIWSAIVDALVYGDAYQEIVYSRGGTPVDVVPRPAITFETIHDEYGTVLGYTQTIDDMGREIHQLKPNQILHLQIFKMSGSVYGQSLVGRAYDDIMRDTKVAESTAVAIERHGFPKYHVLVGLEGEKISQTALEKIDKDFQELTAKNDFVTSHDVEIRNIDEGGLGAIDSYNDISLMRLAGALGVPEEILGLRRGSTDATASTRIQTFFRKIATIQGVVARAYERQLFDRITGVQGSVKLVFGDINAQDEQAKAKWIAEIMKATPIDPFMVLPQKWIREQFQIDPDAYEEDIPQIEDTHATENTAETQK